MNLTSQKRKIILGTVQLGLPYGINNRSGQPSQEEVDQILDEAAHQNIHLLDSAEAYGDALSVIGNYLKTHSASPLRVISKFIIDGELLRHKVEKTLLTLGHEYLYGYMYHRFADYESGGLKKDLLELKALGRIKKIGVSLYSTDQLATCIDDDDIDLVQIPFNPLDASEKKIDLLARAKDRGKEIHVRSVFLQGLFFKRVEDLTGNLKAFSVSLRLFQELARRHGVTIREICLNFALHHPEIDYVVVGVEKLDQLQENIEAINEGMTDELMDEVKAIPGVSEPLLNPSTWKP